VGLSSSPSSGSKPKGALPEDIRRALRSNYNPEKSSIRPLSSPCSSSSSCNSPIRITSLLTPHERERDADSPDEYFYNAPLMVQHNDGLFRDKLSNLYGQMLPQCGGGVFLDLGSSWVSHLPSEPYPSEVWLHGMNEEELDRNKAGTGWKIVRSFNDPNDELNAALLSRDTPNNRVSFPAQSCLLPEIPDDSVDLVGVCAAFQYFRFPERVAGEILRVLKPNGRCVVSFSNRMFSSKAIRAWKSSTSDNERVRYVSNVLQDGAILRRVQNNDEDDDCCEARLVVERTVMEGSTKAALALPLSIMMGRRLVEDPFLAVVVRKQMTTDIEEQQN